MIMGSFDRTATETVRDHETVAPVHEVLRVLGERARAGSLPGKRPPSKPVAPPRTPLSPHKPHRSQCQSVGFMIPNDLVLRGVVNPSGS